MYWRFVSLVALCLLLFACEDSDRLNESDAFSGWLSEEPERAAIFADFQRYLASQNVAGIVPDADLLITDGQYRSIKCPVSIYAMPPRAAWPHIAATLALVRDKVIPAIGPVRIVSGYRPSEFNRCIKGAKQSAHMGKGAYDMVARDQKLPKAVLYTKLCAAWQQSPESSFGLGAYYDVNDPDRSKGRFHIDASGYRSWGFGYKGSSSPCRQLL